MFFAEPAIGRRCALLIPGRRCGADAERP